MTTAQKLFNRGLRYTEVIKTANSKFQIAYLSRLEFKERMGSYSMTSQAMDSSGKPSNFWQLCWLTETADTL